MKRWMLLALYESICSVYHYDERLFRIIEETAGAYFSRELDADTAAQKIQSRVKRYM